MQRDKLLEEQLVRLDVLHEYALMHGAGVLSRGGGRRWGGA